MRHQITRYAILVNWEQDTTLLVRRDQAAPANTRIESRSKSGAIEVWKDRAQGDTLLWSNLQHCLDEWPGDWQAYAIFTVCEQRPWLFTEAGQDMFLEVRDRTHKLIQQAGAVRLDKAIAGATGDSWHMMACLDRMVERGEIREIPRRGCAGQHRIFIAARE